MENVRRYGKPPYEIALLHGGPGAPGSMAPVAYGLEKEFGVIEPLQSADSVQGQVEELNGQLAAFGSPKILIGHSWGAWLAWIYAAQYPKMVRHIILVASGVFDERYVGSLMSDRLLKLDEKERRTVDILMAKMRSDKLDAADFGEFGRLMTKADSYCYKESIYEEAPLAAMPQVYESVWPEAARMRKSGELMALASKISCKITAIHGADDPSPYQGVRDVLHEHGVEFDFILLDKCGHSPWEEKYCAESFFEILSTLIKENK